MPNFIEIGGGSRKFSKKLVDLTRNDPIVHLKFESKVEDDEMMSELSWYQWDSCNGRMVKLGQGHC